MAIETIGVVGCGLMGHGIVQVAAQGGYAVIAVETDARALEAGMQRIEKSLATLERKSVEKGTDPDTAHKKTGETRARIRPSLEPASLSECDLVIEAIVEDLAIKKELFALLGQTCGKNAILATNTSSFPVTDLARASGRPGRTLGLHFFNPVQIMKLVEVVQTGETAPGLVDELRTFARTCGKTPITCKDTPGFVVNRLLVPFLAQALLLLERGDASQEDIDTAMQLGCGHPMGPITLADYVGLDTSLAILEGWVTRFPDEPDFRVPEILRRKVSDGHLGRKTGQGFYPWDGDKKA
jgi:3-hydroxyacyl-CoA dehydrogenase